MKPIRALLADDHTLVRAGIRGLLQGLPGVEVVGEAEDGHEALRLAEALRPDVVLLDIGMPGLNGLEVAGRLAALDPSIRVLILSMHTSEEYVLRALRAGCAGYLLKRSARRGGQHQQGGRGAARPQLQDGGGAPRADHGAPGGARPGRARALRGAGGPGRSGGVVTPGAARAWDRLETLFARARRRLRGRCSGA